MEIIETIIQHWLVPVAVLIIPLIMFVHYFKHLRQVEKQLDHLRKENARLKGSNQSDAVST